MKNIFEVGDSKEMCKEGLERGVQVLSEYINMCEKIKVRIGRELAGIMQTVEHNSAIAMYNDCINNARRMRADYIYRINQ